MSVVVSIAVLLLKKQLALRYKGKIMDSDSFKIKSYLNYKVAEKINRAYYGYIKCAR